MQAVRLTLTVTLICESALFIFFLYGIPSELTNHSIYQKILAALSLSIQSFNNAGISHAKNLFEEGILESSFIIHIGIIGGTILGNLGIFVIIDLFSPVRLRERLANPQIDWSFITKTTFFGSVLILITFTTIYYFTSAASVFSDKNVLESISYLLMEGVCARGFGSSISTMLTPFQEIIKVLYSLFGAGPFSTGGGIGLLSFMFVFGLMKNKNGKGSSIKSSINITKNWFLISLFILGVSALISYSLQDNNRLVDLAFIYTSNHLNGIATNESTIMTILKSFLSILGRLSFVFACIMTIKQIKYASSSV